MTFANQNRHKFCIWLDFISWFSMIWIYMQHIILFLLAFVARLIIARHHPYIIGITGTVGKTTITWHIARFLKRELGESSVGYSQYHYNGEYGLPLTIIGVRSPGRNPILWVWVFIIAISRLIRRYPRYLVLEYGIDHPWEMDFLLSIAHPDIAIITRVEPNHLEQFGTLEHYRAHKIKLLERSHIAIVHESLRQYIDREFVSYSLWALSDIDASQITIATTGTSAIVHYRHHDYPLSIPSIGAFQIENLLPLYTIAETLSISLDRIALYATHGHPESGRSSILSGIHDSTIIDGSYNWGYLSIYEWVTSMRSFVHSHHIVFFLWDMRELWAHSADVHRQLAHEISQILPHDGSIVFYLVGPMMREYFAPILESYFPVVTSLSSRYLGDRIAHDISIHRVPTIVYVKWSQNTIFLEEGIKHLLHNTSDIARLPRQTESWMHKKEIFFKNLDTEYTTTKSL